MVLEYVNQNHIYIFNPIFVTVIDNWMIQITCSFDSGTKLVIFLWRSQKSLNSCDVTTIPSAFLIASFPAFSPPIKRHWKTCTRRILKTNPVKSIRKLTTFVLDVKNINYKIWKFSRIFFAIQISFMRP